MAETVVKFPRGPMSLVFTVMDTVTAEKLLIHLSKREIYYLARGKADDDPRIPRAVKDSIIKVYMEI